MLPTFQIVEHPDIHINLTDIFVSELFGLEIDDNETLEQVVVEDEVDIEVTRFCADAHLPRHKREPITHLQQESLKLRNDG
jgi:hypothetical protein